MWIYIFTGIVAVLLIYTLVIYNSLVSLSNRVEEAFSTMDVYLKKRWDLIPNIVETVKGYAKHEKATLESVTSLRNGTYNQMSASEKINANEQLTAGVTKLMMLAENYPDLKANQNFLDLSSQLTKVEDDIANSRKYYNAVVRNLNNKVEMFPSNIVAGMFGYKRRKMFETDNSERENIQIKL